MSSGPRLALKDAEGAALYLMQEWGMRGPDCMVVGSVRRQRPDVGDLELIAPLPPESARDELHDRIVASLPPPPAATDGLFAAPAAIAKRQALRGAALKGLKPGFRSCELLVELLRKSTGEWHSLSVQIHRYTPQNRGWIELMRTGPSELGILFLERWKKVYGLGDSEASRSGHLRNSYGDIVPVRTEEEAFEKCGIPYVPPERRGVWAESVLQARRLKGESIGRSA